jgi:hypothetical protein
VAVAVGAGRFRQPLFNQPSHVRIEANFEEMGSRIGEGDEIDWHGAVRRESAIMRGFIRLPFRINA